MDRTSLYNVDLLFDIHNQYAIKIGQVVATINKKTEFDAWANPETLESEVIKAFKAQTPQYAWAEGLRAYYTGEIVVPNQTEPKTTDIKDWIESHSETILQYGIRNGLNMATYESYQQAAWATFLRYCKVFDVNYQISELVFDHKSKLVWDAFGPHFRNYPARFEVG